MLLDGFFGNSEFGGYLLVEQANRNQRKYLTLAHGKPFVRSLQLTRRGLGRLHFVTALDPSSDGLEQDVAPDRLLQKIHSASSHGPHCGRNIASAGDKHQRQIRK